MESAVRSSHRWRWALGAEGLLLIALGATGLVLLLSTSGPQLSNEARVLLFPLNSAHSALLVIVGLLTVGATNRHGSLLWWSLAMCTGFVGLFLYGTGQSAGDKSTTWLWLDPSENFLHAGIALVSFVILLGSCAVPWWRQRQSDHLLGAAARNEDEK